MFRERKTFATCLSGLGLATTLMDATTDKDPLVQEQIYNALCYLGESEPEEILNSCDEYLRQHDKVGLCSALPWECQQDEERFLAAWGYWRPQWVREIPGTIWSKRVGRGGFLTPGQPPCPCSAWLTGRFLLPFSAGLPSPGDHPEGHGNCGEEQHYPLGQKHGQGRYLPGI